MSSSPSSVVQAVQKTLPQERGSNQQIGLICWAKFRFQNSGRHSKNFLIRTSHHAVRGVASVRRGHLAKTY